MTPREQLRDRIDTIEEGYEFFLAYAAQGLAGDGDSGPGAELREYLGRVEEAVAGLSDVMGALMEGEESEPAASHRLDEFRHVVADDARKAGAALRLVSAQPSISSQLVDNLNASIHLRALLTDLFLLDEILDLGVPETTTKGGEPGRS